MTIVLTPEVEAQIRDRIERGHYPDADTVIVKALAALDAQEQARFLKTRELVLAGLNSGPGVELTDAVWAEIEREADEADRLGLPIRDEVHNVAGFRQVRQSDDAHLAIQAAQDRRHGRLVVFAGIIAIG